MGESNFLVKKESSRFDKDRQATTSTLLARNLDR
jgi:hypothetical protein